MTPERWQQIEELIQLALAQRSEDRSEFLEQACTGDATLRAEVESFLGYRLRLGDFLETPALAAAAQQPAAAPFVNNESASTRGLAPDTLLQNRYLIIQPIGRGGMGAVYQAKDRHLGHTVALKEITVSGSELSKAFEREARLLARLRHPALPVVLDHFTEASGQFLVMQFIPGSDLAELLSLNAGPFPVDQVLSWAGQLLDVLDYLHTQEPAIIHRDIKPGNLKLTERGEIILLDFGLAKGAPQITRVADGSRSILGYTPHYAPLEQIQGAGTDARSDLYALGATLYYLVTGQRPPDALDRAASLVTGRPDPLQPAHELNPQLSSAFSLILQNSMAQNPEQRFDTAALMRARLADLRTATERNAVINPTSSLRAIVSPIDAVDGASLAEFTMEDSCDEHARSCRRCRIEFAPGALAYKMYFNLSADFDGYIDGDSLLNSVAAGYQAIKVSSERSSEALMAEVYREGTLLLCKECAARIWAVCSQPDLTNC